MKKAITAYREEVASMGKTARRFFSAGCILLAAFGLSAAVLAVFSLSGSSFPQHPSVAQAFSFLGRGAVLVYCLSYITDYLGRSRS